jgi:hypothetical protein
MAYGTVNADLMTTSDGVSSSGLYGFKNRLINSAMVIDQRNAGASVTPTDGQYTLDRWVAGLSQASKFTVQQNAGSITPAIGFSNYLGVTSSSAYSITSTDYFGISQNIEGFNSSDLGWGTANAKTITISFWVYSSLTGTFVCALRNSANNRSYPSTYTISSANTWEQKSITIAGDTTGTWIGATNGIGLRVQFSIGVGSTFQGTANSWQSGSYTSVAGATSVVGTNGATFYITGVQLEKGSTATSFDYRPYTTELALCQRYYEVLYNDSSAAGIFILNFDTSVFRGTWYFKQEKRASATVALGSGSSWGGATPTIYGGISSARFDTTTGAYSVGTANGVSLTASAEL